MNAEGKKKILLIEDDVVECQAFVKYIKDREDVELVGITNSSTEGIHYLKNYEIDVVILDIELQHGKGSGIEFIENLNHEKVKRRPMIVVITNTLGNRVYNFLHSNKVEYIFYKGEQDYSQEKVINLILSLAPYGHNKNSKIVKTGDEIINLENEYEAKITMKINKILDDLRHGRKAVRQKICI